MVNDESKKGSFNVEITEINGQKTKETKETEPKEFEVTVSQDSDGNSQITLEHGDGQNDSGGVSQKADSEQHKKIKVKFITPEEVDRHANSWGEAVNMFYKYLMIQNGYIIKEELKKRGMLDETSLEDLIMQIIKRKDLRDNADKEVEKELAKREQNLPESSQPDPDSSGEKPPVSADSTPNSPKKKTS